MTSSGGIEGTYQQHKPCGYMLNVVNRIDKTSIPYLYRGEDCMEKFIEQLGSIKPDIIEQIDLNIPMVISEEEEELEFRNASALIIFKHECDETVRDAKIQNKRGRRSKQNTILGDSLVSKKKQYRETLW